MLSCLYLYSITLIGEFWGMGVNIKEIESIKRRYKVFEPFMNEKTKRVWAAIEVEEIGYGGKIAVSTATGLSHNTIRKGFEDTINSAVKDL